MRERENRAELTRSNGRTCGVLHLCSLLGVVGVLVVPCFAEDSDTAFFSSAFDAKSLEVALDEFENPVRKVAPTAETKQQDGGEYAAASAREKQRLLRLAACANAAYPGYAMPDEYRPFNEEEWMRCKLLRFAGNGVFDKDGYLRYATGLRARLMVHKITGDVVVAWSGCDFPVDLKGSAIDGWTALRSYWGRLDGQFDQALKIFQGILTTMPGRIEVVGHSLGGALTTYVVAASSDIDKRVAGVTFNGFGLTNAIQGKLTDSQRMKIEELLVNVKGSEDPVFKMKWARHYGIVYNVPQECGMDLLAAHSLDTLIVEMQAQETTTSGDFWKDNAL